MHKVQPSIIWRTINPRSGHTQLKTMPEIMVHCTLGIIDRKGLLRAVWINLYVILFFAFFLKDGMLGLPSETLWTPILALSCQAILLAPSLIWHISHYYVHKGPFYLLHWKRPERHNRKISCLHVSNNRFCPEIDKNKTTALPKNKI